MATAGKFDARLVRLYLNGTSVPVTHQKDVSFSCSADMIDVTTKDSAGFREVLPGTKSWTMSGEAAFAFDASYGHSDLFAAWTNGAALTSVIQTAITGDKKWTGTAYIRSLELSASGAGGDAVSYSYSIEGTGTLTQATI